jgi:hypothetical protein
MDGLLTQEFLELERARKRPTMINHRTGGAGRAFRVARHIAPYYHRWRVTIKF